ALQVLLADRVGRAAESIAEAGAEVIDVDRPTDLRAALLDCRDHGRDLGGGLDAGLPTRTPACGALDGRIGGAADPQRQRLLHGFRRDARAIELEMLAGERHFFLRPQLRDDFEALVHAAAAALRRRTGCGVVARQCAADA